MSTLKGDICSLIKVIPWFCTAHLLLRITRWPLSKIEENAFGANFLQLYRKNEYGDPHFLFHDINKESAFFR